MTVEDVRRLYWAEPFIPFELDLTDGRTFTVRRPNHITISPVGQYITYADVLENFEIIDLVQIKECRLVGEAVTAS
jgi:hypothetical protein